MRKFILIGVVAAIALSMAAGAILAQGDSTTSQPSTAWLGVAVVENNGQVVIARVQSGSPADAADLLIGDVITSLNGTAIDSAATLQEQVQAAAPGDTVTLELERNGKPVSVDVTLGSTPASIRGLGRGQMQALDSLSAAELLLRADLQATDAGYEVVGILGNSSPYNLQKGDVVTTINGQTVSELNLQTLMQDLAKSNQPQLTIEVTRGGETVTLTGDVMGGRFGFERGFGGGFDDKRGPGGNFDDGRAPGGRNNPGRGFNAPPQNPSPEATAQPESSGQA